MFGTNIESVVSTIDSIDGIYAIESVVSDEPVCIYIYI